MPQVIFHKNFITKHGYEKIVETNKDLRLQMMPDGKVFANVTFLSKLVNVMREFSAKLIMVKNDFYLINGD